METTYANLLQHLRDASFGDYRSDPERDEARLDAIEAVLMDLITKLDDRERSAAVTGSVDPFPENCST